MDSPFIGMLASFGFSFAPRNWGLCAGALISIAQNQSLFSLIGTLYGGDGRTVFALPDLRGRAAIGFGQSAGTSHYPIGQRLGWETQTLSVSEMPAHTHTAAFTPAGGGSATVEVSTTQGSNATPQAGDYLGGGGLTAPQPLYVPANQAGTTVALGGVSGTGGDGVVAVQDTGGGQSFSVVQPILAINWSICLFGLYPQRN
ncbi:MAG: tail fiber protein [Marivibrio sp.]|uniref:phage tail protein n=1 Tax=Marivibrio sp. TaxID=2039719 RepID=UPI0032EE6F50